MMKALFPGPRSTRARLSVLAALTACAVHVCAMSLSFVKNDEHCDGANGSIDLIVIGGLAPFTYAWTNGAFTEDISGLVAGTYSVTVTDAASTVANGSSTLVNMVSLNEPSTSGLGAVECPGGGCDATAFISLASLGGSAPYAFSSTPWSVSNNTAYWQVCQLQPPPVTITDANGCSTTAQFMLMFVTGVEVDQVAVVPACNGGPNGSANVHFSHTDLGGYNTFSVRDQNDQQVYTYSWYAGPSAGYLPVPDLLPGSYTTSFTTSGVGCTTFTQAGPGFIIADLGLDCGTVKGRVFVDADDDCTYDTNEIGFPYALLSIQPGDGITFTDALGHYAHNLQYGSYTLQQAIPGLTQICPTQTPVPFTLDGNPQAVTIDLADSSALQHDVNVKLTSGPARPGSAQNVWITLNDRSLYPSGVLSLSFDFDPILQLGSSTLTPNVSDPGHLQWDLVPLPASGYVRIHLTLNVPPDVSLIGYELASNASVTNTEEESDLTNNSEASNVIITGSFDPNDKQVRTSSGSSSTQFFDGADEWIEYTVRFQNTGTDTAFTVVVRDTIAENLDLLSTEIIAFSHSMTADVRQPRVLTFRFADILLPDSATNDAASHGFVTFRIRPVDGLLPGELLLNDADIYFDLNPPVITGQTTLAVELPTAVKAHEQQKVWIHPNPAHEAVRIQTDDREHRIFQLDVVAADGRVVLRDGTFGNGSSLDVRVLRPGAYVARVMDADGGTRQARFIKQ